MSIRHPMIARLSALALILLLTGCDNIATMLADPKVAQREADAKAIGGACRYGLRSIEDCYVLNAKSSKSAIFDGWKEMDQYMRENKVEGIASVLDKPTAASTPTEEIIDESKDKSAGEKGSGKAAAASSER